MRSGWYKRHRRILEYLASGKLTMFDLAVHDLISAQAGNVVGGDPNFPPGVWHGCAASIVAMCAMSPPSEREVRRGIQRLESLGLIRRFWVAGRRGVMPFLVDRHTVSDSAGKVYEVSAAETTDWRKPHLKICRDAGSDAGSDVSVMGAVMRPVLEKESKNQKESSAPDGAKRKTPSQTETQPDCPDCRVARSKHGYPTCIPHRPEKQEPPSLAHRSAAEILREYDRVAV